MTARSWLLILVGMALSLLGWFMPLLMVTRVLASTLFLGLASYVASLGGLILGILGGSLYLGQHLPPTMER